MNVGELVALLTLDSSSFDGEVKKAEGSFSALGAAGNAAGIAAAAGFAAVAAVVVGTTAAVVSYGTEAAAAQTALQAQLGLTKDEASALGSVAEAVFTQGFGESITEVTAAVKEVTMQLGDMADASDIGGITEQALSLQKVFGTDVATSVQTVKTLMTNFGISSDEAFDLMTTGYQSGLDASGDFTDSINEYALQFANGGASADEFFSVLQTGMQGGALGTDKAADLFKEFTLRITDGSDASITALTGLGINVDKLYADMSSGALSPIDAFTMVNSALSGIDDPVARQTMAIALMGTQYEDLGATAVAAISTTSTSMAAMAGSTEGLSVAYTGFGAMWDVVSRQLVVGLQPVYDAVMGLANQAMPYIIAGVEAFSAAVPPAMAAIQGAVDTAIAFVTEAFGGRLGGSLTEADGKFQQIRAVIETVMQAAWGVIESMLSLITAFWNQNGTAILDLVTTAFNSILTIVTNVMTILGVIITVALNLIKGFYDTFGAAIMSVVQIAFNNIVIIVKAVFAILQDVTKVVLAVLKGDWSAAWEGIKSIVTTLINAVKDVITNVLNGIKSTWENINAGLKTTIDAIWPSIVSAVTGAMANLQTAVAEKFNAILDSIKGMASRFVDAAKELGKAIIDGIKNGIASGVDAIKDAAMNAARAALDAAKAALGIKSPSKVFEEEVGLQTALGFARGITGGSDDVANAAMALSTTSVDAASMGSIGSTVNSGTTYHISLDLRGSTMSRQEAEKMLDTRLAEVARTATRLKR